MKNKHFIYTLVLSTLISLWGCHHQFLDVRPDMAMVVPESLGDLQSLLDNSSVMNVAPGLPDVAADDFIVLDNTWNTLSNIERNTYSWQADIFGASSTSEWNYPYRQIFYSNIVLETLSKYFQKPNEKLLYNNLKGAALFFRAMANYQLLQLFAADYQSGTAETLWGIPIKTSARVDEKVTRATLGASYNYVISDLTTAAELLPTQVISKNRPGKLAAWALLARISLLIGNYPNAISYSDSCLNVQNELIDYNTLKASDARPFPTALPYGNKEVLFHNFKISYLFTALATIVVDSTLYKSYHGNDLRKTMFFMDRGAGNFTFKGSYNGSLDTFCGLAIDEVYLIRAEALIRLGKKNQALSDLNYLTRTRYKTGQFVPYQSMSDDEVLEWILEQRRKQLIGRGLRYSDLRRLNREARHQLTIRRYIQGKKYELAPNHPNYIFPIPNNELLINDLHQNDRL